MDRGNGNGQIPVEVFEGPFPTAPQELPLETLPRPSLLMPLVLFLLTVLSTLAVGTEFALAYANNRAPFSEGFGFYGSILHEPGLLLLGIPFSFTLLGILLAHELGHYFACRHHHIHSSYPFFIPAPTLIGTFGAFILIRSPIRSPRALFDVGASGPLVGFIVALPALAYGVLHARIVPTLSYDNSADVIFGMPLALRLVGAILQPNAHAGDLLLHPVGRAAWVGLFATALNLLPVGQLDGGHIVRSLSPRFHRWISLLLPLILLPLGYFQWQGWYFWALLLIGLRFFPMAPIYDPVPLDPNRRFGAFVSLVVFILCFTPAPLMFPN